MGTKEGDRNGFKRGFMKLKLRLNYSELVAFNSHLYLTLTAEPIERLRQNWQVYAVCALVKEVYDKTNGKVEQERLFPTRREKVFSISLTQAQALAVACSIASDEEPAEDRKDLMPFEQGLMLTSFEDAFLGRVLGVIHQAYLV